MSRPNSCQSQNEDTPLETSFHWTSLSSRGRVRTVGLNIYVREARGPPPLARDSTVRPLRRVEADLSVVPQGELRRRRGLDGRWYYDLQCGIGEAAAGRGKYSLAYKGG